MPELPDVETFRRYLASTALHQTIAGVHVEPARVLRGISARALRGRLTGRRLETTRRHGKHLLVRLDDGAWLTLHFGMTGYLRYFKRLDDDPPHDRVRLDFDNGYHLAYVCQRMLGAVGLVDDADAFLRARDLGPDALDPDLDEAAFAALCAERRGGVKSALMDQGFIAGIGNIYSDEILFQAGLHPRTRVRDLDARQLAGLYRAMREVLEAAVAARAGAEGFVERLPHGYLLPYREEGAHCPACGGGIRRETVAGRSAYFCPRCQPAP